MRTRDHHPPPGYVVVDHEDNLSDLELELESSSSESSRDSVETLVSDDTSDLYTDQVADDELSSDSDPHSSRQQSRAYHNHNHSRPAVYAAEGSSAFQAPPRQWQFNQINCANSQERIVQLESEVQHLQARIRLLEQSHINIAQRNLENISLDEDEDSDDSYPHRSQRHSPRASNSAPPRTNHRIPIARPRPTNQPPIRPFRESIPLTERLILVPRSRIPLYIRQQAINAEKIYRRSKLVTLILTLWFYLCHYICRDFETVSTWSLLGNVFAVITLLQVLMLSEAHDLIQIAMLIVTLIVQIYINPTMQFRPKG